MRLTGAALLVGAGALAGLAGADALRRRAALRAALCRMLEMMGYELERFRTPLPDMFQKLSVLLEGQAGELCHRMGSGLEQLGERELAEIWTDALAALPTAERGILLPLGAVLGRYGAEEQLRAVTAAQLEMEQARDRARLELQERGRMVVGVSAAGAALLAVLLL